MSDWIESRVSAAESRLEFLLRLTADLTAQLRAVQQGLQGAYQQWGSGGGGGNTGVYYADGLNIAGTSSATGLTVKQSWTGNNDSTSATVYNSLPDATTTTKRQLMCKNPDNSYTIVNESCANHP